MASGCNSGIHWNGSITRSFSSGKSFINIHNACKRALPNQLITYKHSILLHKIYNTSLKTDWIDLNFNQTFKSRQTQFKTTKSNNFIVRNKILNTRLTIALNHVLLFLFKWLDANRTQDLSSQWATTVSVFQSNFLVTPFQFFVWTKFSFAFFFKAENFDQTSSAWFTRS